MIIIFVEHYLTETGKKILINSKDSNYMKQFRASALKRLGTLKKDFHSMGIDLIEISINKSYLKPLIQFFRMREARR